jgi:CRP/FNR family transcriptional regulator, cyclic AMP receptor protein
MSVDIKYWYLRDHKLFSTLSNSQIKDLCVITRFKKAEKGEIIFFTGDAEERIYFLKKGLIKIAQTDDKGNEVINEILKPGDLFGELSSSSGEESNEYAQALAREVIICSFKTSDFEKVMQEDPALALKYSKLVGFKLRRLRNKYINLVFKDVKTRLIDFLKEWAKEDGKLENEEYVLLNYLTHQDLAHLICATRQTVTQVLNELEMQNKIKYSRKEFIIKTCLFDKEPVKAI